MQDREDADDTLRASRERARVDRVPAFTSLPSAGHASAATEVCPPVTDHADATCEGRSQVGIDEGIRHKRDKRKPQVASR